MHEIQGNGTVFPTGERDSYGRVVLGTSLFFQVFFHASFDKFNKMIFTEMGSAIADEGDSRFFAFHTLDGHGEPSRLLIVS